MAAASPPGSRLWRQALAKPIGEIHVQAIFPQVNTTVKNGAGTEYATGFTRGSVSFE